MSAKQTIKDLFFPFRVLISPLGTFNQLIQNPSAKGLISLSALILLVTAVTLYTSAARIDLKINESRTSLLATSTFNVWFAASFALGVVGTLLYWLVFASGLALISSMLGGKRTSRRILLIGLAYLLIVFIAVYAVRAVVYSQLPTIYFQNLSSWPPSSEAEHDSAVSLMTANWGPLYVYFEHLLPIVTMAWLVMLGAIAVKTLREISWLKAVAVSIIGFIITYFIFGTP